MTYSRWHTLKMKLVDSRTMFYHGKHEKVANYACKNWPKNKLIVNVLRINNANIKEIQ